MAEVFRPRALTYRGTFHQCAWSGLSARRVLPTICVHICSVSAVACQSVHFSRGQMPVVTVESLAENKHAEEEDPKNSHGVPVPGSTVNHYLSQFDAAQE